MTSERYAEMVATTKAMGRARYETVALTPDRQVVAHSTLAMPLTGSTKVYQWGTFVHREHRGHKLGLATRRSALRCSDGAEGPPLVITQNGARPTSSWSRSTSGWGSVSRGGGRVRPAPLIRSGRFLDQLGCATIMIRWCTTSAMAPRPGDRYLRGSTTAVSASPSRTAFVNATFRIVPMLILVIPHVTARARSSSATPESRGARAAPVSRHGVG